MGWDMDTKHTPGDWYVAVNGRLVVSRPLLGDDAVVIAEIDGRQGERLPNAKLIAAAPDLLEACKGLEGIFSELLEAGQIDTQNQAPVIHGWLEAAQAAIYKAEQQ